MVTTRLNNPSPKDWQRHDSRQHGAPTEAAAAAAARRQALDEDARASADTRRPPTRAPRGDAAVCADPPTAAGPLAVYPPMAGGALAVYPPTAAVLRGRSGSRCVANPNPNPNPKL